MNNFLETEKSKLGNPIEYKKKTKKGKKSKARHLNVRLETMKDIEPQEIEEEK